MGVQLSDQPDFLNWKLTRNGVFMVKSMYMDLINSGPITRSLHIWKVKVPLRIKFFMWFVHKQVLLTMVLGTGRKIRLPPVTAFLAAPR